MLKVTIDSPFAVETESGLLDISCPDPDALTLDGIATGLSRLPRFGGRGVSVDATGRTLSVAEHSLTAEAFAHARGATPAARAAVLLHDAHEAIMGCDITTPLTRYLATFTDELPRFKARLDRIVGLRFGVDFARHAEAIRSADLQALAEEKALVLPNAGPWPGVPEAQGHDVIVAGDAAHAADLFMAKAREIWGAE